MFDLNKALLAQTKLQSRICLRRSADKINFIAGLDCGYDSNEKKIGAAAVVLRFSDLTLLKKAVYISDLKVPYKTGFLSFREAPVMLKAVRLLGKLPDIIIVDGNGIAHPRRMGLATYLGVILNASTVGCAKNPIYSFCMPGQKRGEYTVYYDQNDSQVGYCLRTKDRIRPVFISPGNKIDFERARDLVLRCSKYRIPEPLRQAHLLAQKIMKTDCQ